MDTNVLIRIVTQGTPGCELKHWSELKELGERSTLSFLVPEVVLLEFEKETGSLQEKFHLWFVRIEKCLHDFPLLPNKERLWNELEDIKEYLKEGFDAWRKEKLEGSESRLREINEWLISSKIVRVPFENDILFLAKRRMIAGKHPDQSQRAENDCCIIESLIKFFQNRSVGDQLLICTENLKDFGLKMKEKNTRNLHPRLKEGMPLQTLIFTDLALLLEFVRESNEVKEPGAEEVNEALEREKSQRIDEEISLEKQQEGFPFLPNWQTAADVAIRSYYSQQYESRRRAGMSSYGRVMPAQNSAWCEE